MSNDKLYITRREIINAFKADNLDKLFNEKIELMKKVERTKEAKKTLIEMLKSPSKVELLLKMLEDTSK